MNAPAPRRFFTDSDRQVLRNVCDELGISAAIVEDMLLAEHNVYGMGRRHGLWEELEALVSEGSKNSGTPAESEEP